MPKPSSNSLALFLERLITLDEDIYPQPADASHTLWASEAIKELYDPKWPSVLDIGCGDGFTKVIFKEYGAASWSGLAAESSGGSHIMVRDMSFTDLKDKEYDFLLARHVLEHSPMPLLTLMEWRRIVADEGALLVIAPAPDYWGYKGKNHYSVMPLAQLVWLMRRSGWDILRVERMTNHDKEWLDVWEPYRQVGKEKRKTVIPDGPKDVEYRVLGLASKEIVE